MQNFRVARSVVWALLGLLPLSLLVASDGLFEIEMGLKTTEYSSSHILIRFIRKAATLLLRMYLFGH